MAQADHTAHQMPPLIELADEVLASFKVPLGKRGIATIDFERFSNWRSSSLTFLEYLFGEGHTYIEKFRANLHSAADHGEWEEVGEARAGEMIRGVNRLRAAELPTP